MRGIVFDDNPETSRALNTLARHSMIQRLYHDILIDLTVCDLEGWDKREYINQLKEAIAKLEQNHVSKEDTSRDAEA